MISRVTVSGAIRPLVLDRPPEFSFWSELSGEYSNNVSLYEDDGSHEKKLLYCGDPKELLTKPIALTNCRRYCYTLTTDNGVSRETFSDYFETGRLSPDARFIGVQEDCDAFGLSRHFHVTEEQALADARLYVCVLGECEIRINGKKAPLDLLAPWTEFNRRERNENQLFRLPSFHSYSRLYAGYDISGLLRDGDNLLEIWVAGGYYCQKQIYGEYCYGVPRVKVAVDVYYEGAFHTVVTTNDTFSGYSIPVTRSNVYYGEEWNALLCKKKTPLTLIQYPDDPETVMRAKLYPGDRSAGLIIPRLLWNDGERTVYDIGKNTTFQPHILHEAARGETIFFRCAELIEGERCELNFETYSGAEDEKMRYSIVSDGNREICSPHFTVYAGRYVEIIGSILSLEIEEVLPAISIEGELVTSSSAINGYVNAFLHSALTNLHSGIPSDCPHRERLGYTADGFLTMSSMMWFADMREFCRKWLNDMRDCQDEDSGRIPHTTPWVPAGGGPGGWGGAIIYLPWKLYNYYLDSRFLSDYYDSMKRWVSYLLTRCDDGLLTREEPDLWCLGEWCTPEAVTLLPEYVNTCLFLYQLRLMQQIAEIVNREDDLPFYSEAEKTIKSATLSQFAAQIPPVWEKGEQGSAVFAYYAGLIDREQAKQLLSSYQYRTMDTGILGTPLLFRALFELDLGEVAISLLMRTEYPSFGYMLEAGSDTLWEDYSGRDHREPTKYTSRNHPMFGGSVQMLFTGLAGITISGGNSEPLFVRIKPFFSKQLDFFTCKAVLPTGVLRLYWKRSGNKIDVHITCPGGVQGIIEIKGLSVSLVSGDTQHLTLLEKPNDQTA